LPKLKLPRFFTGHTPRKQLFGKLKLLDCPHCGQSSNLIRNGLLYGYDSTQQGMTQIQRGQRIRCSNRGAHSGCGRSFAIYEPETLPGRSVSPAFLFALLKALLDHAGCVHYAWQQGTRWFSLSTAYRMWEALRLHQTQLRHRLCERTAAPASAKYEPRLQLIAHLCAAFEDEDPIKAYHEHFQQPLLPAW